MTGFSPLRFSRYAKDLQKAVYELSREGDPVSFLPSSRTIPHPVLSTPEQNSSPAVQPSAPSLSPIAQLDSHLASAIAELSSSPSSAGQTKVMSMTTPTPGSFAASIRAMMDEARAGVTQARADGLATVQEAVGELNKAKAATAHVAGTMAQTIKDEAAAVLSELGQISNDLGGA